MSEANVSSGEERKEAQSDEKSELSVLRERVALLEQKAVEAKRAHEAEIMGLKVSHAADMALKDAGAKNLTAARAVIEGFLKDARLTGDGRVEGLLEEISRLKEMGDTAFLFGADETPRGFVPFEGGEETDGVTLELLRKMTPDERHRFSVENPGRYKELYGGDI